jgi:hypothetical protein
MVGPLWMPPGRAAVVTSTDKSMPAAPANSGGCGDSDADAPQLSRMLAGHVAVVPAPRFCLTSIHAQGHATLGSMRSKLPSRPTRERRPVHATLLAGALFLLSNPALAVCIDFGNQLLWTIPQEGGTLPANASFWIATTHETEPLSVEILGVGPLAPGEHRHEFRGAPLNPGDEYTLAIPLGDADSGGFTYITFSATAVVEEQAGETPSILGHYFPNVYPEDLPDFCREMNRYDGCADTGTVVTIALAYEATTPYVLVDRTSSYIDPILWPTSCGPILSSVLAQIPRSAFSPYTPNHCYTLRSLTHDGIAGEESDVYCTHIQSPQPAGGCSSSGSSAPGSVLAILVACRLIFRRRFKHIDS